MTGCSVVGGSSTGVQAVALSISGSCLSRTFYRYPENHKQRREKADLVKAFRGLSFVRNLLEGNMVYDAFLVCICIGFAESG